MKKFEIENEVIRPFGGFAYRIRALKDFSDVKEGDLGGYVESMSNLSQYGDCWIYDNAMALNNSRVEENAQIRENVQVYDNAVVGGNAKMFGNSKAYESSTVYGNAKMFAFSRAFGKSEVFGNAEMTDMSTASDKAWVCHDAVLKGECKVTEKTTLTPINISGLYYNVTIMDNHIAVDCVTKTVNDWIHNINTEELLAFDGRNAIRFYKQYKEMLVSVVESNRSINNIQNL